MWEYNTLEMLQDFTREPLQISTIRMFLEHFDLDMYELPDQIRSASNLALVHGEQEYTFTSDDLVWLSCATSSALCKGISHNLLFVGIDAEDEDYYTAASAIIKLSNVVFPGNNQFIFKTKNGIAFGCKRDFNSDISNNFCVTQLFLIEDLKECVYFLEEALFSDESALPYIVMQYSPQEKCPEYQTKKKSEASLDYVRFLRELNDIYGIDTSKEYIRYVESFTQLPVGNQLTYKDVCIILQFVGEEKKLSSYDILNDAITQEELAKKLMGNAGNELDDSREITLGYSQDVLMDAERLLKEMLKKDKYESL